uniref:G_PROTEIN_RECEP_F1_2 domain-containing protein n=1 Tax=Steinernema glaseri TaxID=37863 RepID=A0A1I7YCQ7_9BILA
MYDLGDLLFIAAFCFLPYPCYRHYREKWPLCEEDWVSALLSPALHGLNLLRCALLNALCFIVGCEVQSLDTP